MVQEEVPRPAPSARQGNPLSRQPNAPTPGKGWCHSSASLSDLRFRDSVGISAAELERKLSALAMSEESSQKSPPVAQKSPPPVTGQKGQGAQKNEGQKKDVKANQSSGQVAEDGVHTSKRSRNPAPVAGSSSAATTSEVPIPPNQKVTRGAVSNKVTKPNGRGETLRAAVEAKQS